MRWSAAPTRSRRWASPLPARSSPPARPPPVGGENGTVQGAIASGRRAAQALLATAAPAGDAA